MTTTEDETHPAFGLAVVTRSSGTPRALFQSDLKHNQTIRLSIHRAVRYRDLNHDWTHPTKELIEVEMSLAQWGALVSSIGIGSGVPVTIRRTESEVQVEDVPYEPRIHESLSEVDGAVGKLLSRAQETLAALNEAIEEKKGAKAIREALRLHTSSLVNAQGNAKFAVTSLTGAAERVVSQARADIESSILTAARITGTTTSIEAPSFLAVEAKESE